LESLTDSQLDERVGARAIHVTAGESLASFVGTERLKQEWTVWVLLMVLGLTVGEMALAWSCGRPW
jgi:hypothetical protein